MTGDSTDDDHDDDDDNLDDLPFKIRSEDDLFEAIELIRSARKIEEIRFIGWPRLEITIRGEDFDGGVPTRIMPSLLEFQATINRAYARAVGRRLTREDRRKAELIVRLEPGSTKFSVELDPALNAALQNMTGDQSLIAILAIAAVLRVRLGMEDVPRVQGGASASGCAPQRA